MNLIYWNGLYLDKLDFLIETKKLQLNTSNHTNLHVNSLMLVFKQSRLFSKVSKKTKLNKNTILKTRKKYKAIETEFTSRNPNEVTKINYYKNLQHLPKIWLLHLVNYNNIYNNFFKNYYINIRLKKTITVVFLQKLLVEFFWIKKYLPKNLTKQKIILSWLLFLVTKDSKYLVKILFLLIIKTNFKRHKYILIKIKRLINFFSYFLKSNFLINSIVFSIKGKIGVKGSAKKKKLKYRGGKGIANSKKNIKLSSTPFLIYTDTGVLGCSLRITYL